MVDFSYKSKRSSGEVENIKNPGDNSLPLLFAKQICVETGLWESLDEPDPYKRFKQTEQLKTFQKMAITCSFKDSLIAYHGTDLTEDMKHGLQVIHKATVPWIKGEVVGVLLNKISDKKITNKDFAASISIIVDQLTDNSSGGEKIDKNKTKKLVVRLSNMQEIAELTEKKYD